MVCSICLFPGLAAAESDTSDAAGVIFGPDVSTLGLGAQAGARFNDYFALRLGGSYFDYGFDGEFGGIDYDVDLKLQSAGAILDLHPFGSGFRLSAGVRWNGNTVDFATIPIGSVQIGDQTFTTAEVGRLDGDVAFNAVSPYVGLGYVASLAGGRFLIGFDLGMLYQGKPDIDLRASGLLANDPTFIAELNREADQIEDDLEFLGFYPVVALSFVFRF